MRTGTSNSKSLKAGCRRSYFVLRVLLCVAAWVMGAPSPVSSIEDRPISGKGGQTKQVSVRIAQLRIIDADSGSVHGAARPVLSTGNPGSETPDAKGLTKTKPSGSTENHLIDIRAGRHPRFVSVVFEFTRSIEASDFQVHGRMLRFTLGHTRSGLKSFHGFKHLDTWVQIQQEGENIAAVVGLPANAGRRRTLFLKNPDRLVFNLYEPVQNVATNIMEAEEDASIGLSGRGSAVNTAPSAQDVLIPASASSIAETPDWKRVV